MPDQQVPEEAVESAARAMVAAQSGDPLPLVWDEGAGRLLSDEEKHAWRQEAREALQAAAPALLKQGAEEARAQMLSDDALEEMRLELVGSGWDGTSAICAVEREGLCDDLRAALLAAFKKNGVSTPTLSDEARDKLRESEVWREIHAERAKALEALLEVCPVCENDFSGGGVDEPSTDCANCNSLGFVLPALTLSDEDRERLERIAGYFGPVLNALGGKSPKGEQHLAFLRKLASQGTGEKTLTPSMEADLEHWEREEDEERARTDLPPFPQGRPKETP